MGERDECFERFAVNFFRLNGEVTEFLGERVWEKGVRYFRKVADEEISLRFWSMGAGPIIDLAALFRLVELSPKGSFLPLFLGCGLTLECSLKHLVGSGRITGGDRGPKGNSAQRRRRGETH